MAYISQEKKAIIAPEVKALCKEYGVKASISINNHSTIVVTIASGSLDFRSDLVSTNWNREALERMDANGFYVQVNNYWIENHWNGVSREFLTKLNKILHSHGWYDNSDSQVDYFDTAWYVDINIGRWNKPYVKTV